MLIIDETKLGSGGFSEVFSGRWKNQPVAVKSIKWKSAAELEMFTNEIDIHQQLKHNNIVNLLHTFQEGNYIYLVLELMEKKDLFHFFYVQKHPLYSSVYTSITKDITAGLSYLHAQGYIHRDIKAENILFDANMQAKIADFGLAMKIIDGEVPIIAGSTHCLAPEIATIFLFGTRKYQYTPSIDMYALGITLLEMIFRRRPFQSKDLRSILSSIVNYKLDKPPIETPPAIAAVLTGCLEKNPEHRLGTKDIAQLLSIHDNHVSNMVINKSLGEIIKEGDLNSVQSLLARNESLINQIDQNGYAPIHYAAHYGKISIVRHLIDKGADLNITTPAAMGEHINIRYPDTTALQLSLDKDCDSVTLLLVENSANVTPDNGKLHVIHVFARNGLFDKVKSFINHEPNLVHARDRFKQTPLLWAASRGYSDIVEFLITQGADVNVSTKVPVDNEFRAENNCSALDWAKKGGHVATALILTKAGAIDGFSANQSLVKHLIPLSIFNANTPRVDEDITNEEMANSTFGQVSNRAKMRNIDKNS